MNSKKMSHRETTPLTHLHIMLLTFHCCCDTIIEDQIFQESEVIIFMRATIVRTVIEYRMMTSVCGF